MYVLKRMWEALCFLTIAVVFAIGAHGAVNAVEPATPLAKLFWFVVVWFALTMIFTHLDPPKPRS